MERIVVRLEEKSLWLSAIAREVAAPPAHRGTPRPAGPVQAVQAVRVASRSERHFQGGSRNGLAVRERGVVRCSRPTSHSARELDFNSSLRGEFPFSSGFLFRQNFRLPLRLFVFVEPLLLGALEGAFQCTLQFPVL